MVLTYWRGDQSDDSSLKPDTVFSPEQVSLRNAIGERLSAGLQAPMAIQLLLANFLYSPPGLMLRLPTQKPSCPDWLFLITAPFMSRLLNTETSLQNQQPFSLLPSCHSLISVFFPSTLQELVGNRIQLNRLLGLSNLYYIDPEDQEILTRASSGSIVFD